MSTTADFATPFFAYCTEDDVRNELGNREADETQTDRIIRAINDASRYIEDVTHGFRKYDFGTTGLVLRPGTSKAVIQDATLYVHWPIISIASINEGGVDLTADTHFFFEGYEITRLGGRWLISPEALEINPCIRSTGKIEIKGVFGWAWASDGTDAAPPAGFPMRVRRACRLIAAAITGDNQRQQISPDGGTMSYIDKRIPAEAAKLLSAYRTL